MTKSLRCKGKDQTHYQRLADLCVCVCLCVFYICAYVNAVWFRGSISLPCGAKLREGQPDGYILTSTHPVMSTVCVYLCERIRVCVCLRVCGLAGQPSAGTVQQSRGRTGEWGGEHFPGLGALV